MPSPTPLIIHCPRWDRQRREIMVMPLGLPALANLILDHTGTAPTLVHLGIENEHDPHFRLSELLSPSPPRLLLVSLHWFLQVRPVLDLVRELRSLAPESLVVLGGFTASYFAHEILSRVPSVDAVVVGDGEQPILALTRWASAIPALSRSRLNEIPNLVWRDTDGTIRRNPHRYVLGSSEAASLRHGSLSCLRHHQLYTERALYADFSEGSHESPYARTAYLNAGRGCSVACANCGGGKLAQAALGKRNGILVYPLSKLIRDIEESLSHGVDVLRMSFDPPSARRPMMAWFEAIAKLNPRFRLIYDLWWLPSKALLDSMARAFSPGSTLILSPECGSEAVRKRIRGYPFSNDHLMQAIHAIESRGFRTHCFFSAGLPTESPDDLEETIGLIQRIRGETQAGISVCPMTADPASPLFTNPDAFGATLTRQSLLDFYHDPSPHRPGYRTAYFSESQILDACNRLLQAAALPPSLDPIVDSSSSMSRNSLEIAPNPSKRVVLLVGMFRRIVPEGNDGPFGSQGGFVDNLAPSPYSLANGYLKSFVDANDALRERYDVRLFDIIEPWEPEEEREEVRITDEDIDALLSYHPVLIGFSAYCWNLDAVRTACQTIKQRQPDVRIVVGGRVSQSDARDWLASCPAVDAVVVGEGELAFREILLRDGFSGIAGVLWREGNELRWGGAPRCLDSLDDIPSPFLTGVLVPALHAVMLELSRGCLHACGYCTWNADKRLRHFGSSRIEQELRWAVRQGHQHITLNDSAINYDTERLRDFVEAIERADPSNRLRFTYNFRHDALTEEQFELFQRLPTHVALVGVETLSSRGMAQVDRQAVDVPALRYRLERFARTVRPAVASIVLGLPGDDEQGFLDTLDTLMSYTQPTDGPPFVEAVLVSLLQVYRGSKLWQRREQLGLVFNPRGIPYLIESASWTKNALARCKTAIIRRIRQNPSRLKAAEALVMMREQGGLPVWLSPRVLAIVLRDWPEGKTYEGWTLERIGRMRDTGQGALLRFRFQSKGCVRVRMLEQDVGPRRYRMTYHLVDGAAIPGGAVDRLARLVEAMVRNGEHRAAAYLADRRGGRKK